MMARELQTKPEYANLRNKAMARKLSCGKCIDLRNHRTQTGQYEITNIFVDDYDYCDSELELWIWSIGREKTSAKRIFASTDARYYMNEDYDCLWLR